MFLHGYFKCYDVENNRLIISNKKFCLTMQSFFAKSGEVRHELKAVKPGEDKNENDRLIFGCRHPFFKIYTVNLCTRSCRAGPATPSAKQ